MDSITKYQEDYDQIVELVWQTHNQLQLMTSGIAMTRLSHRDSDQTLSSSPQKLSHSGLLSTSLRTDSLGSHLKWIYRGMLEIQENFLSFYGVEKEEIQQELALVWLRSEKSFREKKPRTSLRDYLLQCSIIGILTWYKNQVRKEIPFSMLSQLEEHSAEQPRKGCFDYLSHRQQLQQLPIYDIYDKYLFYLKYQMDMNILEIAGLLDRDRGTISKHLNSLSSSLEGEIHA